MFSKSKDETVTISVLQKSGKNRRDSSVSKVLPRYVWGSGFGSLVPKLKKKSARTSTCTCIPSAGKSDRILGLAWQPEAPGLGRDLVSKDTAESNRHLALTSGFHPQTHRHKHLHRHIHIHVHMPEHINTYVAHIKRRTDSYYKKYHSRYLKQWKRCQVETQP